MTDPLTDSYNFCRTFARRTARNFYYSFLGLPRDRFRAMCVLYSCMRYCDDIGDDESVPAAIRSQRLGDWSRLIREMLESRAIAPINSATDSDSVWLQTGHAILPALNDIVERYRIPHRYFTDVIDGVLMDQVETEGPLASSADLHCRFKTFEELQQYCYHVAGVVGLCCIHIWGFRDDEALERAVDCGTAFQLTNILRDLGEDVDVGRVYLPAEDLERFDYSPDDLRLRINDERFQSLMEFQVQRADEFYARARDLFELLDPVGRPILQAMMKIYGGLLNEIKRRRYDVYSKRIALPTWQKLLIAADAFLRRRTHRKLTT